MKLYFGVVALAVFSTGFAQESIGSFTYYEQTDPIDDTNRSAIQTFEPDSGILMSGRLIWRCWGSELEVLYVPSNYQTEKELIPVQYRFDDNPASVFMDWTAASTGEAAFAPEDELSSFSRQALKAKEIVLRASDEANSQFTSIFSLAGLRKALSKLACAAYLVAPPIVEPSYRGICQAFPCVAITFQPVEKAVEKVRKALAEISYTEAVDMISTPGLIITFQQVTPEATNVYLRGPNTALRKKVAALFE